MRNAARGAPGDRLSENYGMSGGLAFRAFLLSLFDIAGMTTTGEIALANEEARATFLLVPAPEPGPRRAEGAKSAWPQPNFAPLSSPAVAANSAPPTFAPPSGWTRVTFSRPSAQTT